MQEPELSSAILGTFRKSVAVRAAAVGKNGAFFEESPGLTRYGFNVHFPLFNGALGARLSRTEARAHLARDRKFFDEKGLPFCWWVDSNAEPAGLGNLLEQEGMTSPGPFVSMVTNLAEREQWPKGAPDVMVKEANDADSFTKFLGIFRQVFGLPEGINREYGTALSRCGPGQPWHHYIAYLGEEPVGVRSLFHGGKMDLLLHAAVQEPHRGKGIATAMTRRALEDAAALGSSHCAALMLPGQQARPLLSRFAFADCGEITPYVFGADVEGIEPTPVAKL